MRMPNGEPSKANIVMLHTKISDSFCRFGRAPCRSNSLAFDSTLSHLESLQLRGKAEQSGATAFGEAT